MRCFHPFRPGRTRSRYKGFTLMEAALTTVIVGVGTVGMMQLLAAGTVANVDSNDMTIGLALANNTREMLQTSPTFDFASKTSPTHWGMEAGETATADDLDDFDNYTFSPAVDSRRQAITYLTGWSQTIKVDSVDPTNITHVISHGSMTPDLRPMSRVTVTINHNGNYVCQKSWVVVYAP